VQVVDLSNGEFRHHRVDVNIRAFLAIILEVILLGSGSLSSQERIVGSHWSGGAQEPDLVFVEAPVILPNDFLHRFPKGSSLVRLRSKQVADPVQNLTPDFFAAADPEISFDGTRILFSGQKVATARWQVWEMNADGSSKRQVTECVEDCLRAAYLPGGDIVYTVFSTKQGLRSYLSVSKPDGSEANQITFGPGDFRVETVLRDGRILASASWPLLSKHTSSRVLYTLRSDGSGLESFRLETLPAGASSDAEELDDGSVVFVTGPERGSFAGGKIAIIQRGAPHASMFASLQDVFASPRSFGAEQMIVARWMAGTRELPGRFDLYEFNPASGNLGSRIFADPRFSCVQAVTVAPHPSPKLFWSTLKPKEKAGFFISLNSFLNAESPTGQLSVPITQVRVVRFNSADNHEETLGSAPVEADGSFYVAVPADQPVRFELLDSHNRVIKAEQGWTWARSGEEHGCEGCHADKAIVPENRWPLALRRLDTPMRLGIVENVTGQ